MNISISFFAILQGCAMASMASLEPSLHEAMMSHSPLMHKTAEDQLYASANTWRLKKYILLIGKVFSAIQYLTCYGFTVKYVAGNVPSKLHATRLFIQRYDIVVAPASLIDL